MSEPSNDDEENAEDDDALAAANKYARLRYGIDKESGEPWSKLLFLCECLFVELNNFKREYRKRFITKKKWLMEGSDERCVLKVPAAGEVLCWPQSIFNGKHDLFLRKARVVQYLSQAEIAAAKLAVRVGAWDNDLDCIVDSLFKAIPTIDYCIEEVHASLDRTQEARRRGGASTARLSKDEWETVKMEGKRLVKKGLSASEASRQLRTKLAAGEFPGIARAVEFAAGTIRSQMNKK